MSSQSARVEMLPDQLESAVPARLGEEVDDHVQYELDPVADRVLLILTGWRIKRPVYEHRAANDAGARNEAPVAAIFADVAVVAHAEISVRRDNDLATLNV